MKKILLRLEIATISLLILAIGLHHALGQSAGPSIQTTPEKSIVVNAFPKAVTGITQSPLKPLGQINSAEQILKGLVYNRDYLNLWYLGLTEKNEALYLLNNVDSGKFFWFDAKTGKLLHAVTTLDFDFTNLSLSPDGKFIFTGENADAPMKVNKLDTLKHDLLILDANNLKLLERMSLKTKRLSFALPVVKSSEKNQVAIPVIEFTWDERLKDYASNYQRGARIEIWDWKEEKKLRVIPYAQATGVGDMVFSPDDKLIACMFKDLLEGRHSDSGVLDFINAQTGVIEWHTGSGGGHSVGYPFAFVSPTQFISRHTLFDTAAKTRTELFKPEDYRLKFVGSAPGQTGKVFLLTKKGLELWDWTTQRALRRWPNITDADEIRFSPDRTVISVEVGDSPITQFWKFDPAWLQ